VSNKLTGAGARDILFADPLDVTDSDPSDSRFSI
jgi:hypothetical protein